MNCQIFTPPHIVEQILNKVGYVDDAVRTKTIFEPSFGDGAFLTAIVDRIIDYACKNKLNNEDIYKMLDNVYGVEIDPEYYQLTIQKLNAKLLEHGLGYDWKNLLCSNTLKYNPNVKFDCIPGNPPYVKIQDLSNRTKKYIAGNFKYGSGNTDLYVVFFEKCISLLNENGKLSFITPNSYFKNTSQSDFRGYMGKYINDIVDYGDVIVFDNIATYTAITTVDMKFQEKKYVRMIDVNTKAFETTFGTLGNNPWQFSCQDDSEFIKKIQSRTNKLSDICTIQHGIATNADNIYIVKDKSQFEKGILRPIIKASTLAKGLYIIFPYKWNAKNKRYDVIDEEEFKTKYPKAYAYLLKHKDCLDKRDMDKTKSVWYQYARSQGLHNTRTNKIIFKHIVSGDSKLCSYTEAGMNTFTYSGMYIIPHKEEDFDKIKEILNSPELCRYLLIIGKNMAGGYKSINSKMLGSFGFE